MALSQILNLVLFPLVFLYLYDLQLRNNHQLFGNELNFKLNLSSNSQNLITASKCPSHEVEVTGIDIKNKDLDKNVGHFTEETDSLLFRHLHFVFDGIYSIMLIPEICRKNAIILLSSLLDYQKGFFASFDFIDHFRNVLFLHTNDQVWDRYVGSSITPKEYNTPQKINEPGEIYVFGVVFQNFEDAIRITTDLPYHILISKTFFYNSHSTNHGGSIDVKSGSCIQYHVCSIKSWITHDYYYGCHSSVDATKKNYIIESSISESSGYAYCVHLSYGDQRIDSTNISNAKCKYNAAYGCESPSSHRIKFTSIINNVAGSQSVMHHESNSQSVYRCNVINNNLNGARYGIVYSTSNLQISLCVFSSNSGSSLFYNNDGNFVVDQCFLDNPKVKTTSGSPVSLKTTNQLVLNLHHLSTQRCFADLSLTERDYKISSALNPYQNAQILIRKRR